MNKNKLKKYLTLVLIPLIMFTFSACSDDDNPVDTGNESSAKIQGRVVGTSGFSKTNGLNQISGIEGAVVTVARVQSNGSLTTISNASVVTNAEGKFIVETNSVNERNLVVVAAKGNAEWKAVVSSSTTPGSTATCPPLSDETTAEAEVYARVIANGKGNVVSYSDIQYYIDSKVAAEIKGNATLISQVAAALNAEAEAKAKACADSYFQVSSTAIQTINNAKAEAQAQLEASLYAAGENQSSYDAAFETYQQAIINAYVNAGVEKSKCAKIIEISNDEMMRASASLSAQAKIALRKSSAKRKAYACRKAQEEECDSAGAQPAQKNAVINAGINLEASIDAAVSADEIDAAFEAYHNTVVEQLRITLNSHAAAITSIDATINSAAGLRAVLLTSLAAAVSTDAVVNAYITFYNNVKTLVETQMSAATSAQIKAATEVLVLANM